MWTVENRAGQLLEIRVASPLTLEDVMAVFKQIYRSMPKGQKTRVIVDGRGLRIVDPSVIDAVVMMMRQDNPWVERNAFLMNQGGMLHLQTERMMKELGETNRRAFYGRAEAETWLAEVCSPDEQRRLKRFLDETTT